jgi:hypothetical protein
VDNPGMGKGNEDTLRQSAALRTFIDDEKLKEISEEGLDRDPKNEPKPEDFEPFEDPEKLKEIKEDASPEDKGMN